MRAGQTARARRLLRWFLVAQPDDQEAWLRLASMASSQEARLAYLQRAYTFHPKSSQVQAALRQVRIQQLESAAVTLESHPIGLCRLPRHVSGPRRDRRSRVRAQQRGGLSKQVLARLGSFAGQWSWARVAQFLPLALAFLLPLMAYLFTACSTVYNLDSAEFSAATYVLGIVRATGYPLYLLLGKVFTLLLPIGDVGFRLNVLSALCGAGTIALLYQLLWSLIRQRAAALAAVLLLAFSYYFWAEAIVAEVYTLHTLLMATLLLLLLKWEAQRSKYLLAAIGLLYGLSFGNHLSTVLLAPGIGLFLLVVGRREMWHPRQVLLLLVPFLAGLSIYLYLPLRYQAQPPFNYAGHYDALGRFIPLDLTHPANLWWLVSGRGFRHLMFSYSPGELLKEAAQTGYWLWGNFLGIGLVPGLLGIWSQLRNRPRYLALLAPIFVTNLVFFTGYRVVDKAVMFLPAYLIWTVWMAEGFAWLVRWVQAQRGAQKRSAAWAWGLAALAVIALVVNAPLVNVRDDTRARDRAQAALAQAGPDAIILGWWTSTPPMQYLQLVEGQRQDVLVINRFLIGAEEMYTLIDNSLGQRPVYVMELDEGLIGAYTPQPVGPMYELFSSKVAEAKP